VARAPEEAKVTAMMTAAWRVGSGLILKANFMPQKFRKRVKLRQNCKECAGEVCYVQEEGTRDNATNKNTAMASPWFVGVGKNLVVRK
jgi:hypothetical protein